MYQDEYGSRFSRNRPAHYDVDPFCEQDRYGQAQDSSDIDGVPYEESPSPLRQLTSSREQSHRRSDENPRRQDAGDYTRRDSWHSEERSWQHQEYSDGQSDAYRSHDDREASRRHDTRRREIYDYDQKDSRRRDYYRDERERDSRYVDDRHRSDRYRESRGQDDRRSRDDVPERQTPSWTSSGSRSAVTDDTYWEPPRDHRGVKILKTTAEGLPTCMQYLRPSEGRPVIYFDFAPGMNCPACPQTKNSAGITWQVRNKFAAHWYMSHLPLVRIFTCKHCQSQFKRITDIGRHIRRTHYPTYSHVNGDYSHFSVSMDKSVIYTDPSPYHYASYIPGEWDNGMTRQVDPGGVLEGAETSSGTRLQLSPAYAHWSMHDIYNYLKSETQVESEVEFVSLLTDEEYYQTNLKPRLPSEESQAEEDAALPGNALQSLMAEYTERAPVENTKPAPMEYAEPVAVEPVATSTMDDDLLIKVKWEMDKRPHKGAMIPEPGFIVRNHNLALYFLCDVKPTTYFYYKTGMRCPACLGEVFKKLEDFEAHWLSKHIPLLESHKCMYCTHVFEDISKFSHHFKAEHKESYPPSYLEELGISLRPDGVPRAMLEMVTNESYINPGKYHYFGTLKGGWDTGLVQQSGSIPPSRQRPYLRPGYHRWGLDELNIHFKAIPQVDSSVQFELVENPYGTLKNEIADITAEFEDSPDGSDKPRELNTPFCATNLTVQLSWELDSRPYRGAYVCVPTMDDKIIEDLYIYLRPKQPTTYFVYNQGMRCPVCPTPEFDKEYDFKWHWFTWHTWKAERVVCELCQRNFSAVRYLKIHHKMAHPLTQFSVSTANYHLVENEQYIDPGQYHFVGLLGKDWTNGFCAENKGVVSIGTSCKDWTQEQIRRHLADIPQGTAAYMKQVEDKPERSAWELDERPHKGADVSVHTMEDKKLEDLYLYLRSIQPTIYFRFNYSMRCPVCPTQEYEKKLEFEWHWFSCHIPKVRRMICKQCKDNFEGMKLLKSHCLTEHSEVPFSHSCYDLALVENDHYVDPGQYHFVGLLGKEWTNGYCHENKGTLSAGEWCKDWTRDQIRKHLAEIPQIIAASPDGEKVSGSEKRETNSEEQIDPNKEPTSNTQASDASKQQAGVSGHAFPPATQKRWDTDQRLHKGAKLVKNIDVKDSEECITYLRAKIPTTYFVFAQGMRCPACPTDPFKEKVLFNSHWWHMHTPEARRYPCNLCEENFHAQKVLNRHYYDHHKKKDLVMAKMVKNHEYIDPGVYHYVDKLGKEWASDYCTETDKTFLLGSLCKGWSHEEVCDHLQEIPQKGSNVRFIPPEGSKKKTAAGLGQAEESQKSKGLFGKSLAKGKKRELLPQELPPKGFVKRVDLEQMRAFEEAYRSQKDGDKQPAGEKDSSRSASQKDRRETKGGNMKEAGSKPKPHEEIGKSAAQGKKPAKDWGPYISEEMVRDWDLDGRHHKGAFLMMSGITDVESAAIYLHETRPTTYFEFCPGMRCPACPTIPFDDLVGFQQHWNDFHLPRHSKYVCNLCSFTANRKNGILDHSISRHRSISKSLNRFSLRVSANRQYIDPEEYYFVSLLNADWDNGYCKEVAQQIQLSSKSENWTPKQIYDHFMASKQIKSRVRFKFAITDEVGDSASGTSADDMVELWAADSRPHKGAFIPSAGVCDERMFLLYLCPTKETTYFNFQKGMRCPVCPTDLFSQIEDFKSHWWDKHILYSTHMACLSCEKTFKPLNHDLFAHYVNDHPNIPDTGARRFLREIAKNVDFIETRGYHYCEEVYGGWDNGFCKQQGVRHEDSKLELSALYSNWTTSDIVRHLKKVPQAASNVMFEVPEKPVIPSLFDITWDRPGHPVEVPVKKPGEDKPMSSNLDIWSSRDQEDEEGDESPEHADVADADDPLLPTFDKEQIRIYLIYLGLEAFRYHFGDSILRKFYSAAEIDLLERQALKFNDWLPRGMSTEDIATYGLYRMSIGNHYKLKCMVCKKMAKDEKSFHIHTVGRKHAMVCVQKVTELGRNKYLKEYGHLPGPNTFHLSENHKLLVPEEVHPGQQRFDRSQHRGKPKSLPVSSPPLDPEANAPWKKRSLDSDRGSLRKLTSGIDVRLGHIDAEKIAASITEPELPPIKKSGTTSTNVANILADFVKKLKDPADEEKETKLGQAPWMKTSLEKQDPIRKKEEKLMESAPWVSKEKTEVTSLETKEIKLVENAPWHSSGEISKEKELVKNAPWVTAASSKKSDDEKSHHKPKRSQESVKEESAPTAKAADILANFVKNIKGTDEKPSTSQGKDPVQWFPSEPSASFKSDSEETMAHRVYMSPRFKSGWTAEGFEKVFCAPGTLKSLVDEAVKWGKPHFAYFLFGEVDMMDVENCCMKGSKSSLIIELSECIHESGVWLKKHKITPVFADLVPIYFKEVNRKTHLSRKDEKRQEEYNATVQALNRIIHKINRDGGVEPIELSKDVLGEKNGKPFFDPSLLIGGWLPKFDLRKTWTKEILGAITSNSSSDQTVGGGEAKSGKDVHRVYVTPRFRGSWMPKAMKQVIVGEGTLKAMVQEAVDYGPHTAYFLFGDQDMTRIVQKPDRIEYVFAGINTTDVVTKMSAAIVDAVMTCRSNDIIPIFADIVPVAFHSWNHSVKPFLGAPYSEMQKEYNSAVVALNKLIYANNLARDVGIIHLNQQIIIHRDGEPMFKFDNLVNGLIPNQILKKLWKGELLDSMKLNKTEKAVDKKKAVAGAPWMLSGDGDDDAEKTTPPSTSTTAASKTDDSQTDKSNRSRSRERQVQRSRSRERQSRRSRSRERERPRSRSRSRERWSRGRNRRSRSRERRSRSRERYDRRRGSSPRRRSRSRERHERDWRSHGSRPSFGEEQQFASRGTRDQMWEERRRLFESSQGSDENLIQIGPILPHLDANTIRLFLDNKFQKKLQRFQELIKLQKDSSADQDVVQAEINAMMRTNLFNSGPVRRVLSLLGFGHILPGESDDAGEKAGSPGMSGSAERYSRQSSSTVMKTSNEAAGEIGEYGGPATVTGELSEYGSPLMMPVGTNEYGSPSVRPGGTNEYGSPSVRPGGTNEYGSPSVRPGGTNECGSPSVKPGGTNEYGSTSVRPGGTNEYSSTSVRPGGTNEYGSPPVRPGGTNEYGSPSVRPGGTNEYGSCSVRSSGTNEYGTPPVRPIGTNEYGSSVTEPHETGDNGSLAKKPNESKPSTDRKYPEKRGGLFGITKSSPRAAALQSRKKQPTQQKDTKATSNIDVTKTAEEGFQAAATLVNPVVTAAKDYPLDLFDESVSAVDEKTAESPTSYDGIYGGMSEEVASEKNEEEDENNEAEKLEVIKKPKSKGGLFGAMTQKIVLIRSQKKAAQGTAACKTEEPSEGDASTSGAEQQTEISPATAVMATEAEVGDESVVRSDGDNSESKPDMAEDVSEVDSERKSGELLDENEPSDPTTAKETATAASDSLPGDIDLGETELGAEDAEMPTSAELSHDEEAATKQTDEENAVAEDVDKLTVKPTRTLRKRAGNAPVSKQAPSGGREETDEGAPPPAKVARTRGGRGAASSPATPRVTRTRSAAANTPTKGKK